MTTGQHVPPPMCRKRTNWTVELVHTNWMVELVYTNWMVELDGRTWNWMVELDG